MISVSSLGARGTSVSLGGGERTSHFLGFPLPVWVAQWVLCPECLREVGRTQLCLGIKWRRLRQERSYQNALPLLTLVCLFLQGR
jgi:hypothetical protein